MRSKQLLVNAADPSTADTVRQTLLELIDAGATRLVLAPIPPLPSATWLAEQIAQPVLEQMTGPRLTTPGPAFVLAHSSASVRSNAHIARPAAPADRRWQRRALTNLPGRDRAVPSALLGARSACLAAADGSAPPRAPERALLRPLRRQLLYRRVRNGFLGCGRNVPLGTRAHSGCMDRVDLSHAVPPPKLEHAASLR